jgi:hypothetical protein
MNNQFATQFLLEDLDEFDSLRDALRQVGSTEDAVEVLVAAVAKGYIDPSKAIEIVKSTSGLQEDGGAAAPAGGGGSTTGGGVTNGASWSGGTGEQYAAGTKKVRKSLGEDAPMLAGGKKANISTYTKDGFTKAPTAQEAGKKLKSIDVEELWEKESLEENYHRFRNETGRRTKPEQYHEAVKAINKKLDEVNRLLEFTGTLKTELSEGEDIFEVKHNTKKAMDKIQGKVVEAYKKLRTLN